MDPVYETLRYGTSLALMNRSSFSSTSESPTRSLVGGASGWAWLWAWPHADHAPGPQSERDELAEDGEGSIRSSEDGPGDSGKRGGAGWGRNTDLGPTPAISHPALTSAVFTAPPESEGSGPEKSPGQQVRLCGQVRGRGLGFSQYIQGKFCRVCPPPA